MLLGPHQLQLNFWRVVSYELKFESFQAKRKFCRFYISAISSKTRQFSADNSQLSVKKVLFCLKRSTAEAIADTEAKKI